MDNVLKSRTRKDRQIIGETALSATNGTSETEVEGEADYLDESFTMEDLEQHQQLDNQLEEHEAEEEAVDYEEVEDVEEEERLTEENAEEAVEEVEELEADVGEEEVDAAAERKPAQLPKKRKNTSMDVEANGESEKKHKPNTSADKLAEADDKPSTSARVTNNNENTVDEEQCRVCTSKDDIINLFQKIDQSTIAEMLITICPNVNIAIKDFMPQFICNTCLSNLTIALQLKSQCENTERELRKKLSRSKNKVRRPAGYVVIDAPLESGSEEEAEPVDDVEFKVSDEANSASAEEDSADSDFSTKKKRGPGRGTGSKRGRRKAAGPSPVNKTKRMGRPPAKKSISEVYTDTLEVEYVNTSDEEQARAVQRKRKVTPPSEQVEYPCDECEQVYTRKLSLVLHKKSHLRRECYTCEVCSKQFKIQGAYRSHLEKHRDESYGFNCSKCDKAFPSKADLRRHTAEDHAEPEVIYQCNACKRTFLSEMRLTRHQDGHCPGHEIKQKKPEQDYGTVGKDLFKSVAPLTTTYWSDSFSD